MDINYLIGVVSIIFVCTLIIAISMKRKKIYSNSLLAPKNDNNKHKALTENNIYTGKNIMNVELQNILKQIVSEQGDAILCEPKRVSSFLSDLARDVPKPQKTALVKSLEHGFAQTLKGIAKPELDICKQKLAQELHKEEGLDLGLCEETMELLAAVLFG